MPITANNTGPLNITNQWLGIATEGDVKITCPQPFNIAIASSNAAPSNADVRGHPVEVVSGGQFHYEAYLSAGQFLFVRLDTSVGLAIEAQVTAVQPI